MFAPPCPFCGEPTLDNNHCGFPAVIEDKWYWNGKEYVPYEEEANTFYSY